MKLLGIDIGTTGAKALLIDPSGTVLARATVEYAMDTPQPGWTEQDPDDWYRAAVKCLEEIGQQPDAIGFTGQMHGLVALDKAGRPVRPALLWNDQRTTLEVAEMEQRLGSDRIRRTTLNPPLTGFQVPKLLWIRRHEPELFAHIEQVLLPKDYVRFRLGNGVVHTEPSDASGTGVFDVTRRCWADDLIADLGLRRRWFAPLKESWSLCGETKDGVPIVAGAGDQAAAAVGTGAIEPGVLSLSLGTSGVAFVATDQPKPDPSGAAHAFCHANGAWHSMGVTLSCGGAIRWARDLLYGAGGYELMNREAAAAVPGALGATFLPYLSGSRCPQIAPEARAAFLGLTLTHGRPEMARAVFEGVSCDLADAVDCLIALGAQVSEVRLTGGGVKSALWTRMIADMLDRPCWTLEVDEGPAFGAAILAGVGIGVWSSVEEGSAAVVRRLELIEPSGIEYGALRERFHKCFAAAKTLRSTDLTTADSVVR